ncbi:hypothetical protein HOY34_12980 [Xinfangfangia sp. D13-10-4-6]|uniref:hypothetical protein n=1 Tax=Pseudogemmobacter hezensis TaxID=2737662 RepID=UPI0015556EA3|nr:hypothetical protein [Pseudogemmobacter hezensis]NPD16113.1 hypothetical protein [Pseudogemmobacter hezensis]
MSDALILAEKARARRARAIEHIGVKRDPSLSEMPESGITGHRLFGSKSTSVARRTEETDATRDQTANIRLVFRNSAFDEGRVAEKSAAEPFRISAVRQISDRASEKVSERATVAKTGIDATTVQSALPDIGSTEMGPPYVPPPNRAASLLMQVR